MNPLDELTFIADSLDLQGLHEEADLVDRFLYKKGAVFTRYEKEAVQVLVNLLNSLKDRSAISVPPRFNLPKTKSTENLDKATTVAETYLNIYTWLNDFVLILEKNKEIEKNEDYTTLWEFVELLKKALGSQNYRLRQILKDYKELKLIVNSLSNKFNIFAVNPNLSDEKSEKIAQTLEEAKEAYSIIINAFENILEKQDIDLKDLEIIIDNFEKDMESFLAEQEEILKPLFDDYSLILKGKEEGPVEVTYSFEEAIRHPEELGIEAEKLITQYKDVRKLKNRAHDNKISEYFKIKKLLEDLRVKYKFWMSKASREHPEFDVSGLFDKYHGVDNFLAEIQASIEPYAPEAVVATTKRSLSKYAEDFDPFAELNIKKTTTESKEEVEQIVQAIENGKDSLERSTIEYEQLLNSTKILYDRIKEQLTSIQQSKKRINWELFEKQIKFLIKQVKQKFNSISKSNDEIVGLGSKVSVFDNVVNNYLFKDDK